MDKVIKLDDYDFSKSSFEEESEKDPWDLLTVEDILNASPESIKLTEVSSAILNTQSIVSELMSINPNQFLNSLMFTYVNIKTNESIKEKAKKFKIHENLLFAAYYKIFLPALKKGSRESMYQAYKEVYIRTGIGDSVIKSISAAKSNHKKHAKKIIDSIKAQLDILK